ncbi:MAG: polysaccharide biosynthesis protein [Acidobacteriota bacterium]
MDLASALIRLSGKVPDVDIKIEFTGVTQGEELYEELNLDDETTVPTDHRKIKIFSGKEMPAAALLTHAARLESLCAVQDHAQVMRLIKEMVPEYSPSSQAWSSAAEEETIPNLAGARKCPQAEHSASRAAAAGS